MEPNYAPLNCYHSMPLECVQGERFQANPEFTPWHRRPHTRWLAKTIGFYPLFLAFGTEGAIDNTFYAHERYSVIPKREQPNNVLAIFNVHNLPQMVCFTDQKVWDSHRDELRRIAAGRQPSAAWERDLFNWLWGRMQWYKFARQNPRRVQLLVRSLDLNMAQEIWTQDERTLTALRRAGLKNGKVRPLIRS
jgi:hypothetical protein